LKERFSETAESQPELLAYHYTESGLHEQAVAYWQQAGQRALQRSANQEAIHHLRQGLELLAALPDAPKRTQQELAMQITLGPALMATKGYAAPDVEHVYTRAWTLCRQVGETAQSFEVLRGLRMFYFVRGELQTALELSEQLLALAEQQQDPVYLVEAHFTLGSTLQHRGEFVAAREHQEQGLACYDAQEHRTLAFRYGEDPSVQCLSFAAHTLWYLGYPTQARAKGQEALTRAQELEHPFSVAWARYFAAKLHHLCREAQATYTQTEALIALCHEQRFAARLAQGTVVRGWALAAQGQAEDGIALIHQGMRAYQTTGSGISRVVYLGLLAEAYGIVGQIDRGLMALAEALEIVGNTEVRESDGELHRLKGELLLQQSSDNATEAETCYKQAIAIAQHQQAKSWELRAATSLAKLWQSQNKPNEAYDLLAPVYGWFTEGFDTADLIDAKALLDELSEGQ
jgi:predicted ATPase